MPICDRAPTHTPFVNRDALLTWMLEDIWNVSHEFGDCRFAFGLCSDSPSLAVLTVPVITTLHGIWAHRNGRGSIENFGRSLLSRFRIRNGPPFPPIIGRRTCTMGSLPAYISFIRKPQRYLAFLGRMSPEKSPDVAIRIAQRLRMPLRMAAKVDPVDRE